MKQNPYSLSAFAGPCITQPLWTLSPVLWNTNSCVSLALPLEGLPTPPLSHYSSGAWANLQGRKKIDGEREGKVPFISLYLLCTEEETLLLTAFCMKVKLLTPVWGLFRLSFFFPIYSLSTPAVSIPFPLFPFSLPSSLLSFLVLPSLLSLVFIPLFFSKYFISLHPP